MACGPFFQSAGAFRVDLHDGAVQTDLFNLDADELFFLQFLEQPIQHAGFGPAVHAGVDRMPVAKALGPCPPFAAVLRNVKQGIDLGQVLVRGIAALARQVLFTPGELICGSVISIPQIAHLV